MQKIEDVNWSRLFEDNNGSHTSNTEEYQILSYLQSNGTQAIKLVDNLPPNPRIEVAFEFIGNEDFKWILGAEGANKKYFGIQVNVGSSSNNVKIHKSSEKTFGGAKSHKGDLTYCTIDGSEVNLSWYVISGNSTAVTGSLDPSFESLSSLYAFGIGLFNRETKVTGMITAKLRYIRIDNEMFLPVKRVKDDTCGLLNIATHQFLTDCIAGDPFVAGDIVGHISVEVDDTDASDVVGTAIVDQSKAH